MSDLDPTHDDYLIAAELLGGDPHSIDPPLVAVQNLAAGDWYIARGRLLKVADPGPEDSGFTVVVPVEGDREREYVRDRKVIAMPGDGWDRPENRAEQFTRTARDDAMRSAWAANRTAHSYGVLTSELVTGLFTAVRNTGLPSTEDYRLIRRIAAMIDGG